MSVLEEYHLHIKPLSSAGLLSLYTTFQFFIYQNQNGTISMESASSFSPNVKKGYNKWSGQNTIAAQFMFVGLKHRWSSCTVVALREGNYYKCALDLRRLYVLFFNTSVASNQNKWLFWPCVCCSENWTINSSSLPLHYTKTTAFRDIKSLRLFGHNCSCLAGFFKKKQQHRFRDVVVKRLPHRLHVPCWRIYFKPSWRRELWTVLIKPKPTCDRCMCGGFGTCSDSNPNTERYPQMGAVETTCLDIIEEMVVMMIITLILSLFLLFIVRL